MWARLEWICLLIALGKPELAREEQEVTLRGWSAFRDTRVEVLDCLACIPVNFGRKELLEDALRYIELALAEAPSQITLKGTKAALLIEADRLEEGSQLLEQVAVITESENDRAIITFYRVMVCLKKGDRRQARTLLREAGDKYPNHVLKPRFDRIYWNDPILSD
jgi:hypothetical protein